MVVEPVVQSYQPDLVIVAAGFDAAKGDPLGGCKLTPQPLEFSAQLAAASFCVRCSAPVLMMVTVLSQTRTKALTKASRTDSTLR
eukprot:1157194-Pelagomonas_calceolata.AAC.8